jgi:hypothetical protein
MPRLSLEAAASLPIDLPVLEVQDRVAEVARRLADMNATVVELRDALWENPRDAAMIEERLDLATESDPLRATIEHLPYPLASVLHRYVADGDPRRKLDRLLQYFEISAEFGAIVLLSALHRDLALFHDANPDFEKVAPPGRQFLDRADFAEWINLGRMLGRVVRRLSDSPELKAAWAIAVGPVDKLCTLLAQKDYWAILDKTRDIRNARSHYGAISDRQVQEWLRDLDTLLYQLIELSGNTWREADLLLADLSRFRRGVWTYSRAKRLVQARMTSSKR